jgi:hypothetical protein
MDRELLASLVASATTSASLDHGPLVRLAGRCWPGTPDGTSPAALHWVRRWRPERLVAVLPPCGCATGRCGSCN